MIETRIRAALDTVDTTAPTDLLDAVAEMTPTRAAARSRRARVVQGVAATVVAAAIVGIFVAQRHPASDVSRGHHPPRFHTEPPPPHPQFLSPAAAAGVYAQKLLDRAALPPRTRTSLPPTVITAQPSTLPGPKSQVDFRQQFAAPKSMRDAATYLERHLTSGTQLLGTGSSTSLNLTALDVEHRVNTPLGDVLQTARLEYTITATGPNTSNIQVDAIVIWGPRHPHMSILPREVTVTGAIPGQTPKTVVVTDAVGVSRLFAAFEASPTIPVGSVYHCPAVVTGAEQYTVSYAAAQGERPAVVVKVTATGCRIAEVKMNGRGAPLLMGGNLVTAAQAALHG